MLILCRGVQRHPVADARRMLIGVATAFVTPMVLLLTDRWPDNPDISFDKVVRILSFVCATRVPGLTRKVLLCECY